MTEPVYYNVDKWIQENQQYFLPPVCNKMMHQDGQMKVFLVGGPNQRKDYHIEEGEEGNMCLKVLEQGKHRDIIIKEGEVFLLPGRIAHSPNRVADTIGLVIERERSHEELDGLRYYMESGGVPTLDSLYEEWFHCTDLGTQLAPVIKRFFASEQYKTGSPRPGTIPEKPPVTLDFSKKLQDPFNIDEWLDKNKADIEKNGYKQLFEGDNQFQIFVYGKGDVSGQCDNAEAFIWQLRGSARVTVDHVRVLGVRDTLLIPEGKRWTVTQEEGSFSLVCYQDPTKKK